MESTYANAGVGSPISPISPVARSGKVMQPMEALTRKVAKSSFFESPGSSSDEASPSKSADEWSPPNPRKRAAAQMLSPVGKSAKVLGESEIYASPEARGKVMLREACQVITMASPRSKERHIRKIRDSFTACVGKESNIVTRSGARAGIVMGIPDMGSLVDSTIFKFVGNVQSVVKKECPEFVTMLNLDHITTPTREGSHARGFHFCPKGSLFEKCIDGPSTINPMTGVWCAHWEHKKVKKQSTFFPQTIDSIEHLVDIFAMSEEVLREGNRSLRKVLAFQYPGQKELQAEFFIEVYSRNEGTVIWSAFPLFHYMTYHPDDMFHFTHDFSMTAQQIIDLLASGPFKLAYSNESCDVIDIAPLDARFPVSQGILMRFDGPFKAFIAQLLQKS